MSYIDIHVHIGDVIEVAKTLRSCFDSDYDYEQLIRRKDSLKDHSSSLSGSALYSDFEAVMRYLSQNEIPYWACVYDSEIASEGDINKGWINADSLKFHNDYWCESTAEMPIRDLYEAAKNPQTLNDFIKEKTFRYEMPDFKQQKKLRAEAKTTSLLLGHV